MAAYFIAHGTLKDAKKMEEYVERSSPIVASFGGEFIGVGNVSAVLTGSHNHKRTALFKFPNTAAVESWYNSEPYKELWPLRKQAGDFDFVVFEEYSDAT